MRKFELERRLAREEKMEQNIMHMFTSLQLPILIVIPIHPFVRTIVIATHLPVLILLCNHHVRESACRCIILVSVLCIHTCQLLAVQNRDKVEIHPNDQVGVQLFYFYELYSNTKYKT